MRRLIVLLIMFLCSCKMQADTVIFEKILSDLDKNSYFVSIDISSPLYNGRTIIENGDLYFYFAKTEGLDELSYKKLMVSKLQNKEPLRINDTDFTRRNFKRVLPVKQVSENAKYGVDKFVKTYFKGNVLKDGVSEEELSAIIDQLFRWRIASKIDDESGYLVIFK